MGRKALGSTYTARNGYASARITLARGQRISVALQRHEDADGTLAQAVVIMARYARTLHARCTMHRTQLQRALESTASRIKDMSPAKYLETWTRIERDDTLTKMAPKRPQTMTFMEVADEWTSGRIHALNPNVPLVSQHARDAGMLRKHVFEVFGRVPIQDVDVTHLNAAYASMHATGLRNKSKLYVWKLCYRVLQLAHKPLGIIPANPIVKGDKPKARDERITPMFYPEDDAQLLGCVDVCIHKRMLYGFLARQGMRRGEALALRWCDIDPEGMLTLWRSKTRKANMWLLPPSELRTLTAYRATYRAGEPDTARIFAPVTTGDAYRSIAFRRALRVAGVFTRRPQLALHSRRGGELRQIRIHDLRRLFVTLAVAQDRSDAFIRIRTGHTSSRMIVHYTDHAAVHQQRKRVELVPFDEALPEIVTALRHEVAAEE